MPAPAPASVSTSAAVSASAAPLTSAALRDQCELATEPLTAVHAFLSLLCDCSIANAQPRSGMRMGSLAVLLRDLAEQLAEAERQIDHMAAVGREAFPDARLCNRIEDQGCAVFVVRCGLCVLDDAIGASGPHEQDVAGDAFTGTLYRMADRLQAVKVALDAMAFPPREVPSPK